MLNLFGYCVVLEGWLQRDGCNGHLGGGGEKDGREREEEGGKVNERRRVRGEECERWGEDTP